MDYLTSYLNNNILFWETDEEECEDIHVINENIERLEKMDFNLDLINESYCIELFRFTSSEIRIIHQKMRLSEHIILSTRSKITSINAFVMVLRRLVYPNRLRELESLFGRCRSDISGFIKVVVQHIINLYGHLLRWDSNRLTTDKCAEFARAISDKESRLPKVIGFIDGTIKGICKPKYPNRIYYNGHKRLYCVKYQNICTPDGIVVHMCGPWYGSRHASFRLKASRVVPFLRSELNRNGHQFIIYGDAGYKRKDVLITPFKGHSLTTEQEDFNNQMKSVRMCVEWTFQKIISLWAFLDFKKNLKLRLQPIGEYYQLATILTNIHSCLYGPETASYFNTNTPHIDEYFNYYFCLIYLLFLSNSSLSSFQACISSLSSFS